MAFSTKNAQDNSSKFGPSQYIQMGPIEAKITKIEVLQTKAGDKWVPLLHFESKPIGGDFKGVNDASGQIAKVKLGSYSTGSDGKFEETIGNFAHIAKLLGVREAADKIEADSITDFCKKIEALIKGKYLWWLFGAEEKQYEKDGQPKVFNELNLPRYGFVEISREALQAKQKGGQWPTKDDPYYFKKLVKTDPELAAVGLPPSDITGFDNRSIAPAEDTGLPF